MIGDGVEGMGVGEVERGDVRKKGGGERGGRYYLSTIRVLIGFRSRNSFQ